MQGEQTGTGAVAEDVATKAAQACPFCPGAHLVAIVRPSDSGLNSRLAALGLPYGLPGSHANDVSRCPRCGFLAIFHRPADV